MESTDTQTAEERLLLTLIQKVEDNTAAVRKLLQRDSHKSNVLKGWLPCNGCDQKEEAKWIRKELQRHSRGCGTWPGQQIEVCTLINHKENAKHLKDSGFALRDDADEMTGGIQDPWEPGQYGVCWTAKTP